jgi:hypothetical protein
MIPTQRKLLRGARNARNGKLDETGGAVVFTQHSDWRGCGMPWQHRPALIKIGPQSRQIW